MVLLQGFFFGIGRLIGFAAYFSSNAAQQLQATSFRRKNINGMNISKSGILNLEPITYSLFSSLGSLCESKKINIAALRYDLRQEKACLI
ncbi:MAG: hypothetical protein J6W06_03550 [Bacteroidales bacterium]|jgi:hypothetical protein|nr:hypothetical protein [Bacteroidales bacterium]